MARSLDPIGAQLPISHNPLIRVGYQPPRTELKIEDLIKQWQQGWQQFGFTALKEITGLDFSSPTALVLSLGDLIGDATQDVLKTLAKVFGWGGIGIPSGEELTRWVGQQVFGLIDPSRLPQIPLGAIVKSSPNLLSNGSFSDAAAILDSAGKWVVDNTVFRTAAGSARTSADGTIRELLSADLIPVKAGQKLDVSGFVKYTGLTASAGAVQLGLTTYGPDKETVVSRPQIAALGALSNATANWPVNAMSGTYTTPQTGVSFVRVRLTITEGATAGTVWFDDLVAHVGGNLLSIDWIDGLAQQLVDFANDLGAAVQDIANRLTMATWQAFLDAVKGGPGGLVDHIVDKLQHLGFDGKFDAAQLFNIAGSAIQTFMDTVGGTLGATWVDIQNRLSGLGANGTVNVAKLPNIDVSKLPDLQSAIDQIAKVVKGGNPIGQAVTSIGDNIGAIFGSAQNAQQQASNNAAEIAAIKAAQTGAGNSGKSGADQFAYTAAALNSTSWDVGLSGSGGVRTDGNNAYWNDVGGAAAIEIDRYKAVTVNTDSFITAVVLASTPEAPVLGSAECYNWILGRMSADRQNYVGMRLGYDSLSLWKVIGGAAAVQIGATQSYTLSAGERPALICGVDAANPRRFRMLVGDTPIGPDIEDTSGILSLYGPNYRQGGMRWDAAPRFGGQSTPGKIAAFTIADWTQPTYVGSTARMQRSTTVNVAASTTGAILPANTFNTSVYATPDITASTADGSFTVSVKGNYLVKISAHYSSGAGYFAPAVYVTPSGSTAVQWELGAPGGRFPTSSDGAFLMAGGEVCSIVPLSPGDKVSAGYQSDAVATVQPRFSIARLPTGV
ncbi:hypothetical protein BKG86_17240 [Mycobacteroides chelonae]|uniref:DUF7257 domain-containing protein n=1 Tax=Mycobacteroides chelonae TaxID=1774 RepID=UPI0008A99CCD|nr:hypothetical protein [Mycobacteroides chelonae]OHU71397.1 hypothetical protein BKG86_17240 [Mycobacteroides chelonae]